MTTRCHGAAMIEVEPGAYGRCPGCPDCARPDPFYAPVTPGPSPEGARRRDVGVSRSGDHAPAAWVGAARQAVRDVCRAGRPFTTDDVWDRLSGYEPPEPRAMGQVMTWARRNRWCAPTDQYVTSRRDTRQGGPVRVWQPIDRSRT